MSACLGRRREGGSARRDRGGQSGRCGPDRAGTPTRDPQTPPIRPETRGAAPARAGPAAPLRLHVGRRATPRWSRQAANPTCHRSGSRLHPAADSPAAPPAVAESVPRLFVARVLAPSEEAFDTPLGSPRSLTASGVCYSALRRLPRRDFHPLEKNSEMQPAVCLHRHDARRLDYSRACGGDG
jgi:hypothetical protein